LIDYDRAAEKLMSLTRFAGEDRRVAEDARLTLELALNRSAVLREIVLLAAVDEVAMRCTHQRYFDSLAGILAGSKLLDSLKAKQAA
jgi:hypothetical protein